MFIQYSQRFWRPIQDLSDKYNILQAAMAACERIFKLLTRQPEIVSPRNPRRRRTATGIEFRHVWFTYQKLTRSSRPRWIAAARTNPGRAAGGDRRHRVDSEGCLFTIEPGQTVAIVGHTGAGKTTLTSLMMRFYDVTAGQILIDGVDLREQT